MDDWASVTRASHTPTCEQRHAAPPLAARLGRAPPSVAAPAAGASARDAARTLEVQARRSVAGTRRSGRGFYLLALRGAERRAAAEHCSEQLVTRILQRLYVTEDESPPSGTAALRAGWERGGAVPGGGGGGAARRVGRVGGRHGPSLVTREGGPASEGSQRKRVQNTATHTHTDYEPELCAIV